MGLFCPLMLFTLPNTCLSFFFPSLYWWAVLQQIGFSLGSSSHCRWFPCFKQICAWHRLQKVSFYFCTQYNSRCTRSDCFFSGKMNIQNDVVKLVVVLAIKCKVLSDLHLKLLVIFKPQKKLSRTLSTSLFHINMFIEPWCQ